MTKQTIQGFLDVLHEELLELEIQIVSMKERLEGLSLMGDDPEIHF